MNELQMLLVKAKEKLEKLKGQSQEFLDCAPEGYLRIATNKGTRQFYWRKDPKDFQGSYIRKKEKQLIENLAQRSYAEKILKQTETLLDGINRLLDIYHPEQLIRTYEMLSYERQKLVKPYVLSDQQYIEQWYEQLNNEKQPGGDETSTEIYTEKNEMVRSKSEKMIADKLYMMGIPYVYEAPLFLKGYGYIKPDFTLLNIRTRETWYLEHLGMMDKEEYCEKAVRKIETYEKNGIFQGRGLLLTYETSKHPLNTRNLEQLLHEFLE